MEDKLADTAPKRPLALTIGAAAVTILVVAGVFAAPTVVTCFSSPDGMGQCIRGKFAEAGLFPTPPATVVADVEVTAPAEPPAATESSTAEEPTTEVASVPETELAPPVLDVTPPVEIAGNLVAATFGLLRAEPDGSVVIAGSGTPGSEVEVYSNGSLLGRATVETSGDWVLVPDAPLPPGGVEITLAEAGKTGEAEQSFVVVIDEDRTAQPLVVASAPGQATEILQGLDRPSSSETTQLAAADPVPQPEPVTPAAEPEPTAAPVADAPVASDTPVEAQVAPVETPAEPVEPAVTETPAATASPAEPAAAAVEPPAPTEPPTATASTEPAAPVETTPETPNVAAVETPAAPAVETPAAATSDTPATPEAPQADATPPAVEEEPAAPPAPPSIDAIEIEGNRTYFAGAGPEGGIVRLYVDDQFVADATVEGGRWLVEAGAVLDAANQRVRADLLAPGSSEVASRAEVDFVVDLPEVETDVASADVSAVEPAPPAVPVETPEPPAPIAIEAPAAPVATPTPEAPAIVEEEPAPVGPPPAPATEPSPAPEAPAVTPPAEPAPVQPAPAEPTPAAPEPAVEPAPVETPPVEVPAVETPPVETPAAESAPIQPAPATPTPLAPIAVQTEPAVPTMVAVSVGSPDAQRFSAGKAIIRRGDNLWTIARRAYGEGIKYTTIYEANTGQIRDPDRIYPGQVFDLPN